MPRIKVVLTVEFDADSPDQEVIDLALNQLLLLQPSCSIISKRVIEIDGTVVGENDASSLQSMSIARESRSSARPRSRDGLDGDTYRPDHSDRGRDQRGDSYRPASSTNHASSSRIDSYRPNKNLSSDTATMHPDRMKFMTRSENPKGPYGTRYDALAEGMIFKPSSQSSSVTKPNHGRRGAHYSPPPRRDRSASPARTPRRSERLRSAAATSRVVTRPLGTESAEDLSHLPRKPSERELSHVARLEIWRLKREETMKRIKAGLGALEEPAPRTLAKGPLSERNRFERQQESTCTRLSTNIRSVSSLPPPTSSLNPTFYPNNHIHTNPVTRTRHN
jgi:hypothetical protein